jgi:hypothetical protein
VKTLPREPWRGGQICGEQLEYGVVGGRMVFCGEFKKLGSPLCVQHDEEARLDNYGTLPTFASGNALGLAAYRRTAMPYMFQLAWEPMKGDRPIPATREEIKAWEKSDR